MPGHSLKVGRVLWDKKDEWEEFKCLLPAEIPSHLLEPGRCQAAKEFSKRSSFSFSYEIFSL